MLNLLKDKPQRIVIVGDRRVSPDTMEEALRRVVSVAAATKLIWESEDEDEFSRNQLALERGGPEAAPYAAGLAAAIKTADVVFTHMSPLPAALLAEAASLKVILTNRGGLEHIDLEAASQRNIPVINVIRNAIPVAEFTLGLILSVTRNIAASHHLMRQGVWQRDYANAGFVASLYTLTVGLAGLGNVGIELARRLKALGAPLIAHEDWLDKERLAREGLADIELVPTLADLFRRSDVVSLHLRLTPDNAGMIDRKYFSLMKNTAYLINAARGGLINQGDLVAALRTGQIAGAALDVYDSEPLGAGGLAELDNVTLTPHIAGTTVDALGQSPYLLAQALEAVITKDATERIVNLARLRL
ncbi:MAG: hypothetical protein LBK98_01805 [Peptococcaceae bacterium]|jgi:D-3-phosphoglycerate dehydrogenase|nr:hypothetical protein [Peptococcaceae bacterium]